MASLTTGLGRRRVHSQTRDWRVGRCWLRHLAGNSEYSSGVAPQYTAVQRAD